MLIKILSDNLFVGERLREIDKGYFLVFNTEKERFEVHIESGQKDTFCVGVPFGTLDERVVDLVRKTRVENIENIIENIEKENRKIENKNKKIIFEKMEEVFYDS